MRKLLFCGMLLLCGCCESSPEKKLGVAFSPVVLDEGTWVKIKLSGAKAQVIYSFSDARKVRYLDPYTGQITDMNFKIYELEEWKEER